MHASAFAIVIGLVLAYVGGLATHGHKGLADVVPFAGLVLARRRDATRLRGGGDRLRGRRRPRPGAPARSPSSRWGSARRSRSSSARAVAYAFGFRDAVSLATIGAGANAYIIGTATGTALGAASPVIALSIATGVLKAVLVMVGTPFVARAIGLDNPRAAMIYGGVMGSVSGVTAGLAATDRRLIPYGALTSTFHTGLGCLLCPSAFFLLLRLVIRIRQTPG